MSHRNNSKDFPELDLRTLKKYAHRWAKEYSSIFKVYLHLGAMESGYKYIFVIVCPGLSELDTASELLISDGKRNLYSEDYILFSISDYYNWADPACLHIRENILDFYKEEPSPNYDYESDWMWFNIELGELIPPGMVDEKYYWVLYESLDFPRLPAPDEFLITARSEAQILYKAIKADPGISIKGLAKGTELRQAKAFEYYKSIKHRFEILRRDHFEKKEIFEVNSRPNREIIGSILHEVVSKAGYASNGAQKLFERSQKLLKKLPNLK